MNSKIIIGNLFTQFWSFLMSILFIPFYIKIIGIDSYGIIGLFTLLQTTLNFLDFGLIQSIGREMGFYRAGTLNSDSIRDLLRTVEISFLILSFIIIFSLNINSNYIINSWIKTKSSNSFNYSYIFFLISIIIPLRFYESFYKSAQIGLQNFYHYNLITILISTLRGFGTLIILKFISSTLVAFFIWQVLVTIMSITLYGWNVYFSVKNGLRKSKFSKESLFKLKKFALGSFLISILSVIFMQVDKIIFSKILLLKDFALYSFSSSISNTLFLIVTPIAQTYYPKFCQYVANEDYKTLRILMKEGNRLLVSISSSVVFTFCIFSHTILLFWTNDINLVKNTYTLSSLLLLGNYFNAINWLIYNLQLAYGITFPQIRILLILSCVTIILIYFTFESIGINSGVFSWIIVNLCYLLHSIFFILPKLHIGEIRYIVIHNFLVPILPHLLLLTIYLLVSKSFRFKENIYYAFLYFFISIIIVFCVNSKLKNILYK